MDEKKARETLDKEVTKLKEFAVTSTDSAIVAEYIAISDKSVQEKFLQKLNDGYVFKGISCLQGTGTLEYRHVEFHFDCAVGSFCFIPPSFMVIVDIASRVVVKIVDPYLSDEGFNRPAGQHLLGDGDIGWPKEATNFNVAWDGWGPFMMNRQGHAQRLGDGHITWPQGLLGGREHLLWGGYLPFSMSNQSWKPEVQLQQDSATSGHVLARLTAPNGCYSSSPGQIGTPSEVSILPEQIGIILPVNFSNQEFCPQHVVPMNWDLPFPLNESKTSLIVFVTVNGVVKSQTAIGLLRGSAVRLEKDLVQVSSQ